MHSIRYFQQYSLNFIYKENHRSLRQKSKLTQEMEKDPQNYSKTYQQPNFNCSVDQMTSQQLQEYQRQLMAIILARSQNQVQKKPQEVKNEQQYEKQSTQSEQRISQSFLVYQQDLNNSSNYQPSQHDTTFPFALKKNNQNLRSTRAQSQQSSQYSYPQSQSASDILPYNIKQPINSETFVYKSENMSRYQNLDMNQILDKMNQSSILSQSNSQPSMCHSQLLKLSAQFGKRLQHIGHKINEFNLKRAMKSQAQLRAWYPLFIEDKDTGLFKMDLISKNGTSMNDKFFTKLQQTDLYLLFKIQIGVNIKQVNLKKLFDLDFESLIHLLIQRKWDNKKQDYKEHGLDFITNVLNQKRLRLIEWKSDQLTNKFVQSFKDLSLKSLIQLKLDFSQKIQDQQSYGDLLQKLFSLIDQNNDDEKFRISLFSSVQKMESLGRSIENYEKRLEVNSNGKNNQIIQQPVQQKAAQQQKAPVQQQQAQQPVQPVQAPIQQSAQSSYDENLKMMQLIQRIKFLEKQKSPNHYAQLNPNNQPQTINHFEDVKVNTSNNSTTGSVNIGGQQYNFK